MVDVLENSEVRSGLLSEFAKKKGLSSLDDEDVEPLRELEAQHQLSASTTDPTGKRYILGYLLRPAHAPSPGGTEPATGEPRSPSS